MRSRTRDQATPADPVRRRRVLATLASAVATGLAGCQTTTQDADVVAGPDGSLVFEPSTHRVAVGDTVTWWFATGGHNVCGDPADHPDASLPAGATAFASYGPDTAARFVPRGGTYEHTFRTPGEYHYVCVPHADRGMTGVIRVE